MLYPNYKKVHEIVKNVIKKHRINMLPVDPLELLNKSNIPCIPFSVASKFPQYTETVNSLREENVDACCVKKGNKYIIFYDDEVPYPDRIPFTIAHELGHVELGHFDSESDGMLKRFKTVTSKDYREIEANEFAAELLAPIAVTHLTGLNHPEDISRCFKVSYSCASVILKKLENLNRLDIGESINFYKSQFYNFINSKYCTNCHAHFRSEDSNFCPFCGKKGLLWANFNQIVFIFFQLEGGVPIMNYNTYPVNPITGTVSECPQCDNKITHSEWNYCPICSLPTLNKCSSCDNQLAPHFRYCPDCGKESIYFLENALESWDVEAARIKAELEESNMQNSYDVLY